MHEYNLRVGSVVISLGFRRERLKRAFIEYFQRPSLDSAGDIRLNVAIKNEVAGLSEIPNSLFLTKRGDGGGFSVADGLITGRYSAASGEGELIVQAIILEGNFARIFEQILYQAFWSATRKKGIDAILLHSSGIVRNGRGYAFSGKSGSGKSTVTALSEDSRILNDEISIIEHSGAGAILSDTPFNGFYRRKQEGRAQLSGVLLLEHAPYHRVTRIRTAESIKTLSREIIPPMGLETPLSPTLYLDMLECAKKIHDAVPIYRMEFLPDPGFWKFIERAEGVL
jgi:hypothetical protein